MAGVGLESANGLGMEGKGSNQASGFLAMSDMSECGVTVHMPKQPRSGSGGEFLCTRPWSVPSLSYSCELEICLGPLMLLHQQRGMGPGLCNA